MIGFNVLDYSWFEQWGMLSQWVEHFPTTYSTAMSRVLSFALFVTAGVMVALKILRRPDK